MHGTFLGETCKGVGERRGLPASSGRRGLSTVVGVEPRQGCCDERFGSGPQGWLEDGQEHWRMIGRNVFLDPPGQLGGMPGLRVRSADTPVGVGDASGPREYR